MVPGEGSLIHPLESTLFLIACLRFKKELCLFWPFDMQAVIQSRIQLLLILFFILAFSVSPKYSKLSRMVKDFQPYYDLWTTVSDWMQWHESWMNDPLVEIEAEQLEKNVSDSFKTMQRCMKQFKDSPGR